MLPDQQGDDDAQEGARGLVLTVFYSVDLLASMASGGVARWHGATAARFGLHGFPVFPSSIMPLKSFHPVTGAAERSKKKSSKTRLEAKIMDTSRTDTALKLQYN